MIQELDQVILVNERDEVIGTAEKLSAHIDGLLHRAFSVFVMNDKNELLMQQRADGKYHSGGLWTNTCCSHPRPNETTVAAAHRRLVEEMGFDCEITELFTLLYKSDVGNGLIEHEFDHIFVGVYNGPIAANDAEVKDFNFMQLDEVASRIEETPGLFTVWMRIAFPQFLQHVRTE